MKRYFILSIGIFAVVMFAESANAQGACTHYASPAGVGNGLSQSSPFQIGNFWGVAQPGNTLCLLDGTYTNGNSMINPPPSVTGAAGNPITLQALNEGRVLIKGNRDLRPVDLQGSYIAVRGINAEDGNAGAIVMRGSHGTVQRSVAWCNNDCGVVIDIGGSDNLLEDCAAFGGPARKIIAVGARGGNGPNTVRRCWARFEVYGGGSGSPTNNFEMGYDQNNVTFENILATRNVVGPASSPEAPISVFSTLKSKLLGSIAYLSGNENFEPNVLAAIWDTGGSHAGQTITSNMLVKDFVGVVSPAHPRFKGIAAFNIGANAGSGNIANNLVGISGIGGSCWGSAWSCTNVKSLSSIAGHNVWQEVRGVCKRYVNGQLTNEPLWPWAMNQRIKDALVQSGRQAVDITATMESLLGTIPSECKGSGATLPARPSSLHLLSD